MIFIRPQQLAKPKLREHVAQCGGFKAYLKEGRAISRIEDMICHPIVHHDQDSQAIFREGMELYAGLTEAGKQKITRALSADLFAIPSYVFESPEQTRKLTVLATFFEEAAKHLPVDERGDRINSPLEGVIEKLRSLAETNSHYSSDDPSKSAAKVASLNALWQLGYPNLNFWDEFLLGADHECQSAVIKIMLEEPMREGLSWDEHPWSDLQLHLSSIGPAILASPCEKKFEFLQRMLFDEDVSVVRKTLELFVYSEQIPAHFYAIARDIGRQTPELAQYGDHLETIHSLREQIKFADDRQFIAARQLVQLYRQYGLDYLRPLLEEVGSEMLSVYAEPSESLPKTIQERREMLVRLGVKMPGSSIPSFQVKQPSELEAYRNADEATLELLEINHLATLTGLIWAGKQTLSAEEEKELDTVGIVILRKIKQQEERQKALSVLVECGMAGIQVEGFQLNVNVTGQPAKQQPRLEDLSIDELYQLRQHLGEEFAHAKQTNDKTTQEMLREQLAALRSAALRHLDHIDECSLDQLVCLGRMVRIGQVYGEYSQDTLSTLDLIAAKAIQKVKKDKLLVLPVLGNIEQMSPERRAVAEARIQKDQERQKRFDELVPDTPEEMARAAQILRTQEVIRLTIQSPRVDLEQGYLSNYLISLCLHHPGSVEPVTETVVKEPAQKTVLYEPYLVGTLHDFFVDQWSRFKSWLKGGRKNE